MPPSRAVHRIDPVDPGHDRRVVARQVVLQPVGSVLQQPGALEQLAREYVAVAHVLQLAVDPGEVGQVHPGHRRGASRVLRAREGLRDLIGELELRADPVDAARADLHGEECIPLAQVPLRARLRDQHERGLGVDAHAGEHGAEAHEIEDALLRVRIHEEEVARRIAGPRLLQRRLRRVQVPVGGVDASGGVAMELQPECRLELRDARLAGLPGGSGAEQDAVPGLVEERVPIVVPGGVEQPRRAAGLPLTREALDVRERHRVVRPDPVPAAHAGRDPGLHPRVAEGLEKAVEARARAVLPPDRDHVLRQRLDHRRVVHRDVSPEEEPLPVAPQRAFDVLQVLDVHRPDGERVHPRLGLSLAQLEGLVSAEVHEGRGEERVDLREDGARPLQRPGLAGRKHMSVRRLRERCIDLLLQHVMQVPERLLLWDHHHVMTRRVRDEFAHIVAAHRTEGGCDERVRTELERVLEVR